jgi:purine nucleosidase
VAQDVIIDCDPGVDDAVALLLAFASPRELNLLAVTTVAGNVSIDLTTRNARCIRELARRNDVPIYAGCERPLAREPIEAGHFHGVSGLGTLAVEGTFAPAAAGHAVDVLVDILLTRPAGSVTVVTMGPMTNLAAAMQREPRVISQIARVVSMGGARREGGNITASAEYNIYADPHAAQVVLQSGARCVLISLDATHQVLITPARIAALLALQRPQALAAAELLRFSYDLEQNLHRDGGVPLHDPCTVAYLLQPQAFRLQKCRIAVETASPLTMGHTAVELRLEQTHGPLVEWAVEANGAPIFQLLTERLAA